MVSSTASVNRMAKTLSQRPSPGPFTTNTKVHIIAYKLSIGLTPSLVAAEEAESEFGPTISHRRAGLASGRSRFERV